MRKHAVASVFGLLILGAPIMAADELPTGRDAEKQLFKTNRVEVQTFQVDGLSENDQSLLSNGLAEALAAQYGYYGAVAVSPNEGLLSESIVASANHHSLDAARASALAECNDKKARGSKSCVIAAEILPRRYEPGRALELSLVASEALGKEYRRLRGDKAFAISASSGSWGIGTTEAEAKDVCASNGAKDCVVVVRN